MRYRLKIKRDWKDLRLKLKNDNPVLMDADLEYAEGDYEQMIRSVGQKLGKTRQEFIRLLNKL
jgi:hypothetical protein